MQDASNLKDTGYRKNKLNADSHLTFKSTYGRQAVVICLNASLNSFRSFGDTKVSFCTLEPPSVLKGILSFGVSLLGELIPA